MIGLTTANQTFLASGKRGFPVFGAGFGKCLLWRIYGWLPREAMDVRRELEMGAPS